MFALARVGSGNTGSRAESFLRPDLRPVVWKPGFETFPKVQSQCSSLERCQARPAWAICPEFCSGLGKGDIAQSHVFSSVHPTDTAWSATELSTTHSCPGGGDTLREHWGSSSRVLHAPPSAKFLRTDRGPRGSRSASPCPFPPARGTGFPRPPSAALRPEALTQEARGQPGATHQPPPFRPRGGAHTPGSHAAPSHDASSPPHGA